MNNINNKDNNNINIYYIIDKYIMYYILLYHFLL